MPQSQNQQPSQQLNTIEREPFRWLFTAEFQDGTTIEQDLDDTCKSRTDGTGSTFTDVLEKEKESPLVAFHMYHVSGKEAASVDLFTGAFVVNGTPLHAHNQYFEPHKYPLKLVYFRESRVDNDVKGTVLEDGSVDQEHGLNPRHYVNRYFIGWTTELHGKNKQVTIAVG